MYAFIGKWSTININGKIEHPHQKKSFCTSNGSWKVCYFTNFFQPGETLLPSIIVVNWIIWSTKSNRKVYLLDEEAGRSFCCTTTHVTQQTIFNLGWEVLPHIYPWRFRIINSIDAAFFSWTALLKYDWDKKWIDNFIIFKSMFFLRERNPKFTREMAKSNRKREIDILMTKYYCI